MILFFKFNRQSNPLLLFFIKRKASKVNKPKLNPTVLYYFKPICNYDEKFFSSWKGETH